MLSFRRAASLALIAMAAALVNPGPAVAAGPASPPEQFVDSFGVHAVEVLKATKDDPAARRSRFAELARKDLDARTIAALVLGRAWRSADDTQRQRFSKVFEDHLITTYARRFDSYAGQRLEVLGRKPAGDDVLVNSKVIGTDGKPIQVDWRVRLKDGNWRIIDASVEGVSMVVTWRNEFASVIQQDGLDGLIARLETAG